MASVLLLAACGGHEPTTSTDYAPFRRRENVAPIIPDDALEVEPTGRSMDHG